MKVKCRHCGQSIQFTIGDADTGSIRITCPNCQHVMKAKLPSGTAPPTEPAASEAPEPPTAPPYVPPSPEEDTGLSLGQDALGVFENLDLDNLDVDSGSFSQPQQDHTYFEDPQSGQYDNPSDESEAYEYDGDGDQTEVSESYYYQDENGQQYEYQEGYEDTAEEGEYYYEEADEEYTDEEGYEEGQEGGEGEEGYYYEEPQGEYEQEYDQGVQYQAEGDNGYQPYDESGQAPLEPGEYGEETSYEYGEEASEAAEYDDSVEYDQSIDQAAEPEEASEEAYPPPTQPFGPGTESQEEPPPTPPASQDGVTRVKCDQCGMISSVANAKIPEKGVWGRCPKCRNKIFITMAPPMEIQGERTVIIPFPTLASSPETLREEIKAQVQPTVRAAQTTKVTCPECGLISSIPNAKIPDKGVFGRCPGCKHRFFIQKDRPAPPVVIEAPGPAIDQEKEFPETAARVESPPYEPDAAWPPEPAAEEAAPIEEPAPMDEAVPPEEPTPMGKPVSVEEPAPMVEPGPMVQEPLPQEEPEAFETAPVEDAAAVETMPAEEPVPVEEPVSITEPGPTDQEPLPQEADEAFEAASVIEDEVTMEMPPADEAAPALESVPADEPVPMVQEPPTEALATESLPPETIAPVTIPVEETPEQPDEVIAVKAPPFETDAEEVWSVEEALSIEGLYTPPHLPFDEEQQPEVAGLDETPPVPPSEPADQQAPAEAAGTVDSLDEAPLPDETEPAPSQAEETGKTIQDVVPKSVDYVVASEEDTGLHLLPEDLTFGDTNGRFPFEEEAPVQEFAGLDDELVAEEDQEEGEPAGIPEDYVTAQADDTGLEPLPEDLVYSEADDEYPPQEEHWEEETPQAADEFAYDLPVDTGLEPLPEDIAYADIDDQYTPLDEQRVEDTPEAVDEFAYDLPVDTGLEPLPEDITYTDIDDQYTPLDEQRVEEAPEAADEFAYDLPVDTGLEPLPEDIAYADIDDQYTPLEEHQVEDTPQAADEFAYDLPVDTGLEPLPEDIAYADVADEYTPLDEQRVEEAPGTADEFAYDLPVDTDLEPLPEEPAYADIADEYTPLDEHGVEEAPEATGDFVYDLPVDTGLEPLPEDITYSEAGVDEAAEGELWDATLEDLPGEFLFDQDQEEDQGRALPTGEEPADGIAFSPADEDFYENYLEPLPDEDELTSEAGVQSLEDLLPPDEYFYDEPGVEPVVQEPAGPTMEAEPAGTEAGLPAEPSVPIEQTPEFQALLLEAAIPDKEGLEVIPDMTDSFHLPPVEASSGLSDDLTHGLPPEALEPFDVGLPEEDGAPDDEEPDTGLDLKPGWIEAYSEDDLDMDAPVTEVDIPYQPPAAEIPAETPLEVLSPFGELSMESSFDEIDDAPITEIGDVRDMVVPDLVVPDLAVPEITVDYPITEMEAEDPSFAPPTEEYTDLGDLLAGGGLTMETSDDEPLAGMPPELDLSAAVAEEPDLYQGLSLETSESAPPELAMETLEPVVEAEEPLDLSAELEMDLEGAVEAVGLELEDIPVMEESLAAPMQPAPPQAPVVPVMAPGRKPAPGVPPAKKVELPKKEAKPLTKPKVSAVPWKLVKTLIVFLILAGLGFGAVQFIPGFIKGMKQKEMVEIFNERRRTLNNIAEAGTGTFPEYSQAVVMAKPIFLEQAPDPTTPRPIKNLRQVFDLYLMAEELWSAEVRASNEDLAKFYSQSCRLAGNIEKLPNAPELAALGADVSRTCREPSIVDNFEQLSKPEKAERGKDLARVRQMIWGYADNLLKDYEAQFNKSSR